MMGIDEREGRSSEPTNTRAAIKLKSNGFLDVFSGLSTNKRRPCEIIKRAAGKHLRVIRQTTERRCSTSEKLIN